MSAIPREQLTPKFVPSRFSRARFHSGESVLAIGGAGDKTLVLLFQPSDGRRPVEVSASSERGAAAVGTENHVGVPIASERRGVELVYHDGMWAPGPGPQQVQLGSTMIHWETSLCHSIAATTSTGTVSVRAARDVDFETLLRITESVPAIGG